MAVASASASLSNALSITLPRSSYSTPAKYVSLRFQCTRNPRLLLRYTAPFSDYTQIGDSRWLDYGTPSFSNSAVPSHPEDQTHYTNDLEGSNEDEFQVTESAVDKKLPSSLKSLMQVYKQAIIDGDGEAVYEIENVILMIEKEKIELAQKVSVISAEISSGKEKYIRLQADFHNYRKRLDKERLTVRTDAQGVVMESLLPLVDSFERAKQQIKLDTDKEKKIDASYQGIYKQFVEIMRSLRVAAVPTVGKPFDPKMHEAIAREESLQFKEGIITQEFRRGFYLGDRLLRPAMVKVSSGPGKKKSPVPEQSSANQQASVAGVDNH